MSVATAKPKTGGRAYSARKRAAEAGAPNPAEDRIDAELRREIAAEFGEPFLWIEGRDGARKLGKIRELPLAALFAAKSNGVLFEVEEGRIYSYDGNSGLWRPKSDPETLVGISKFMLAEGRRPGFEQLEPKRSIGQDRAVLEYTKGLPLVAKRGIFAFDPAKRNRVIHCANGVVEVKDNQLVGFRHDFRREDYSRNQIAVGYDPRAKCPRFLGELLGPALPDESRQEDIVLLSKFFGLFALGINLPQKILILDGASGTGKTTLAKLAGLLVGESNRMMLRTDQLIQRFELSAFIGRTLLMAGDVKQRFLLEPGAMMLKSLVGGDMLHAETKHGAERIPIRGCFNVIITANARLRVKIESDRQAWRRRLAIVSFEGSPPAKKIVDFENVIWRQEAPGILNWALEGLEILLAELESTGDMILSDRQAARVEELLSQSEALESFLRENVEKADGCRLTKSDVREKFWDHCRENKWDLPPKNEIGSALPTMMKRIFGAAESHSIPDGGRQVYGYAGVGWRDSVD